MDKKKSPKTLTLCMIVKDEERFIGDCLNSIFPVVDEIIIVDTGSTDKTKDICRQFGVTILDFPWNDDFSAARNYGVRRASGDWILWLDADEVVEKADYPALKNAIEQENHDCLCVHLINFVGDKATSYESFQVAHLRLFRNHQGIEFEGKIHEHLNIESSIELVNIPVRVYHYGYMRTVSQDKKKSQRNLQLLERELQKANHSPWLHYHIASEYFNQQRFEDAFSQVNQAILYFMLKGLKPPAMCYRLKYLLLLNYSSVEGALPGIEKAIQMYPDYVDLHFFKGILLYANGNYTEAIAVFQHCIELGDDNLNYLTMNGVGGSHAWLYIGKCQEGLENFVEAKKAYAMTERLSTSELAQTPFMLYGDLDN